MAISLAARMRRKRSGGIRWSTGKALDATPCRALARVSSPCHFSRPEWRM